MGRCGATPGEIDPSNGNSTHLVDKPGGQGSDHGSEEWREAINRQRTGEVAAKGEVSSLPQQGHRSLLDGMQIEGGKGGAYFPISAVVKRSLRVPPVTERNAELKRPVMKRKTTRTADEQGTQQLG